MLQFPGLSGICNISHFITTRHGGVSSGGYSSMNPGEYSGDDPESVRMNRQVLAEAVGVSSDRILAPYQVHGDKIFRVDRSFLHLTAEQQKEKMQGVDALITDIPGVCIAVSTADCVPVLLYAPDKQVVAAVHAGWRGTVQQIVAKTIRCMVDCYGCDPQLMRSGIAPSISQDAFEVGEEVTEAFRNTGVDMDSIMKRSRVTGKAHIDLSVANRIQLQDGGLPFGNIEMSGICTYTNHSDFFSARRLGIKSGRILSGIFLHS